MYLKLPSESKTTGNAPTEPKGSIYLIRKGMTFYIHTLYVHRRKYAKNKTRVTQARTVDLFKTSADMTFCCLKGSLRIFAHCGNDPRKEPLRAERLMP